MNGAGGEEDVDAWTRGILAAADASNGVRAICYRSWTRSRPMIILRISLVPAPIS